MANTIHSPDYGPAKDCYGWDPMLDGDSDDTVFDQDLDMPDNPHGEISGNTRRMMDKQFARPTYASIDKDFIGLENTLNDVLQVLWRPWSLTRLRKFRHSTLTKT